MTYDSHVFLYIFLIGTVFEYILSLVLEAVNMKARRKNGGNVPAQLEGYVESEKLLETLAYKNSCLKLWLPKHNILAVVNLLTVLFLYRYVFQAVWNWTGNAYLTVLLFVLLTSLPAAIIEIPFDLIREFVIEKKFGFSKMTAKMWIADQLKGLVVGGIVGAGLLSVAVALLIHASAWWPLLLGAVYCLFMLIVNIVYPIWIAPLFNKFTPLEEGELKTRLESLLERTGFKSSGIFVMDASKRSSHSNAYFTGIGKTKRIVLYDTLIAQLTPEEIEAVLAHELGHYKKRHVVKGLCSSIPLMFLALFAVYFIDKCGLLYASFNVIPDLAPELNPLTYLVNGDAVPEAMKHYVAAYEFLGLMFIAATFSGFSPLLELVTNAISRKHEFQADTFSAELCGSGKPLSTALIKLNKENLSDFTPAKIYSVFNYNHPPLLERIRNVENIKN